MINKLTGIFMFLNFVALLGVGYLMFWPVELAEVYNEPFPVRPAEVKRGGELEFYVHFKKTKQYQVTSNRNIICADGNLVTLAPNKSHSPLGEHKTWTSITIPQKASLGTCYLQLENTYHINPIRTLHRELRTQDFTIVE